MSKESVETTEFTAEEELAPPRVGVMICECGGKIGGVIDTGALCRQAALVPGVVYARREAYPCSRDGQERLRQAIQTEDLERVLIAGCSPRLMRSMFRNAVRPAGLDRSYLNMANLREQCIYVHGRDPQVAFQKAVGLIEMGVARLGVVTAAAPRISRVVKTALIIGSDLPGLTVALSLAEAGYPVTVVERRPGFDRDMPDGLRQRTWQQAVEKGQAALQHPQIDILFNARLSEVTGHPGDFSVTIQQGDQTLFYTVGAIVVANAARPKPLGAGHWFDRERVKTQAEFEVELEAAGQENRLELNDIVMIFCAEEVQRQRCSRVCCNIGIRQAIRAKQLNPQANITILFRELYLGGIDTTYEEELLQARDAGIAFFRYRKDRPPVIGEGIVSILDTLTGEAVRVPFDRAVLTMPLVPEDNTDNLAALLGLPVDQDGFLAEPRVRLRPGRYAEPGIYALGSAQRPADTAEGLFQAYLTSSRVARFLSRETITVETPVARIDPGLCTGCGNCSQVCSRHAIRLEQRDGLLSLSEVDDLRCFGCGNCVVACPVKAIHLPGWDEVEIPVQISAALDSRTFQPGAPRVIALTCEWSAYAAADLAGVRHMSYPANVRILRTNCSARFDAYHILWAFLNGADGVFLGACPPGECHYGTGNLFARERVEVLKTELADHGIDPRRLRLEFLSVDDGSRFARAMTEFMQELSEETMIPFPRRTLWQNA